MSKWEVKHEKKEIFEVRFEAANLVHDVFEGIRVPQPWIYERDCRVHEKSVEWYKGGRGNEDKSPRT